MAKTCDEGKVRACRQIKTSKEIKIKYTHTKKKEGKTVCDVERERLDVKKGIRDMRETGRTADEKKDYR